MDRGGILIANAASGLYFVGKPNLHCDVFDASFANRDR